jgi:hypothetical protein
MDLNVRMSVCWLSNLSYLAIETTFDQIESFVATQVDLNVNSGEFRPRRTWRA